MYVEKYFMLLEKVLTWLSKFSTLYYLNINFSKNLQFKVF